MINYERPIIARQALLPLAALILVASIVQNRFGWQIAAGFWLVTLLLAYLYRDPRRRVPPLPLGIVAPIDGKVVSVIEQRDPYLARDAVCINMRGRLLGAFGIRSAMEGKVNDQWFGSLPDNNEDHSIYKKSGIPAFAQWTQSDEGDDIVTTLTPRFFGKDVNYTVHSGERTGQGKRCGFAPFGVNAEIFVPAGCRIEVRPGDRIQAGASVIATLVR
ncbi:MAG: phosphatidylserine decarboxylase [Gammaproteobacteria bacterium]|nr:phosphatidylserine decarboxylase [Gammaproteobacteria bacterium]